jgi:hypothetical protein
MLTDASNEFCVALLCFYLDYTDLGAPIVTKSRDYDYTYFVCMHYFP